MQRTLILGAAGQVGRALQQIAPPSTIVVAHDVVQTDVRSRNSVERTIGDIEPDVIINCAAFTNVDEAETQRQGAMELNALAPGAIAELAHGRGIRLVHISTDYVFDGRASTPYPTSARPSPLNTYGQTKLEGERRVLAAAADSVVVRTAWVHSAWGANFVKTATRRLEAGTAMRVVDDQIGTPTRALHLARALWAIADRSDVRGVLHFTDSGVASWFDVAVAVRRALQHAGRLGGGASVAPVDSMESPRPAVRPAYSVLDKHDSWRVIGYTPPDWVEGVTASVSELLHA